MSYYTELAERNVHQREEIERLRAALTPFAIDTRFSSAPQEATTSVPGYSLSVKLSDFQRAFDVLAR